MKSGERDFVLAILDDFEIQGPNGIHRCIVTEVLGPTLQAAAFYGYWHYSSFSDERLPLPMARKLAVQLAKGLEYIHSYGVIHGGMCLRPGRGVT
jgi:serine/threonine-protein kinase SRPK3